LKFDYDSFDPKVIQHLDMVLQANEITNLTSIRDRSEGLLLHVEDSLHGLIEINDAPKGKYADLGTGGGFPGIPIAITTGRNTTLVDSVRKKTDCLDTFIEKLGISDHVRTYWGRVENLSTEERGSYSVVSARALTQLVSLMELSSPLLKRGGRLVAYKANVSDEEMSTARSFEETLGLKLISQRDYYLSDEITHRCLIVFEKISEPTIKLPRKIGFAQKKPLHL